MKVKAFDMHRPLHDISDVALRLKVLLGPHITSNHTSPTSSHHIPALDLPSLVDIQSYLQDLGVPSEIVKRSSEALLEMTRVLQHNYEATCHKLAAVHRPPELLSTSVLIQKLRSAFQNMFWQQQLPKVREQILAARMLSMQSGNAPCQLSKGRRHDPFNYVSNISIQHHHYQYAYDDHSIQEYIPLLEKYFEHNAYPSTADRAVLARISMMTARQIEVWVRLATFGLNRPLIFKSVSKSSQSRQKRWQSFGKVVCV
jgi:hypothetical protein